MEEALGTDDLTEIRSSNGIYGGEVVGKLEGSPLGELLGAYGGDEICASDGMPGEKVSAKREVLE